MKIFDTLPTFLPTDTVIAVGFFDGVHIGHKAVIEAAISHRREGQQAAAFSFLLDGSVPKAKVGAKMLTTLAQKAERMEKIGADMLICPPFSEIKSMSPEEYAHLLAVILRAKTVCCGYDYKFGKGAAADAEDLRKLLMPYGVELVKVDAVTDAGRPISSTRIRALIENGEPDEAARLLGFPFMLDAPVVRGNKIGRKLGFPTANQRFSGGGIVPKYGVYATRVTVDGKAYPAVTNVGVKPTVGDDLPGAESWLPDFSGDLYDKTIRTEFIAYLREEKKFDSLEELSAQIKRDAERAVDISSKKE